MSSRLSVYNHQLHFTQLSSKIETRSMLPMGMVRSQRAVTSSFHLYLDGSCIALGPCVIILEFMVPLPVEPCSVLSSYSKP